MLIAMDQVIHDIKNEPVTSGDKPFTLGQACVQALGLIFEDERNLSGEEKVKRFKIAMKIEGAIEVELSVEEVALLKKVTGKAYSPAIVYPIWKLLDPTV